MYKLLHVYLNVQGTRTQGGGGPESSIINFFLLEIPGHFPNYIRVFFFLIQVLYSGLNLSTD